MRPSAYPLSLPLDRISKKSRLLEKSTGSDNEGLLACIKSLSLLLFHPRNLSRRQTTLPIPQQPQRTRRTLTIILSQPTHTLGGLQPFSFRLNGSGPMIPHRLRHPTGPTPCMSPILGPREQCTFQKLHAESVCPFVGKMLFGSSCCAAACRLGDREISPHFTDLQPPSSCASSMTTEPGKDPALRGFDKALYATSCK